MKGKTMTDEFGCATTRKALLDALWRDHGLAVDWAKFSKQWCVIIPVQDKAYICATGWNALYHFTIEQAADFIRTTAENLNKQIENDNRIAETIKSHMKGN